MRGGPRGHGAGRSLQLETYGRARRHKRPSEPSKRPMRPMQGSVPVTRPEAPCRSTRVHGGQPVPEGTGRGGATEREGAPPQPARVAS